MRTVETVGGRCAPDALGLTLMHEHLLIGSPGWEAYASEDRAVHRERTKICVDRILELRELGVRTLLDPCPTDLGRDGELMAAVAQESGLREPRATRRQQAGRRGVHRRRPPRARAPASGPCPAGRTDRARRSRLRTADRALARHRVVLAGACSELGPRGDARLAPDPSLQESDPASPRGRRAAREDRHDAGREPAAVLRGGRDHPLLSVAGEYGSPMTGG